jgi:ribosomal protein S18 acetylase RimI-like enzyme
MVLDAQCDLYQLNFPRFVCTAAFVAEQAQRLRQAQRRPFENGLFVLEDEGRTVGFVWVVMRMDLQGAFGSVDQVYLLPEYRHQGLGRLLMDVAHHFIKNQGVNVARLYVTEDNQAAVKLYQAEKYQVTRFEMERTL